MWATIKIFSIKRNLRATVLKDSLGLAVAIYWYRKTWIEI